VFGIFTLVTSKVVPDGQPSFIVDESHFSAAVMKLNGYDFFIKETREGTLKDIARAPTHFYSGHNLDVSSIDLSRRSFPVSNAAANLDQHMQWYMADARGRTIAKGTPAELLRMCLREPWAIRFFAAFSHSICQKTIKSVAIGSDQHIFFKNNALSAVK
jgi:hypothetical protein